MLFGGLGRSSSKNRDRGICSYRNIVFFFIGCVSTRFVAKIHLFACLEVDMFSISFLNIKNRGATAPPIVLLFFPETTTYFSSDDILVGTLSSSFLEGQLLSQNTYLLRV